MVRAWLVAVLLGAGIAVSGCSASRSAAPVPSSAASPGASSAAPSQPGSIPPSAPGGPSAPAAGVPRFDHIVIAVFENKGYDQIIGSSQAPYLNRVAGQGALFTDSHAVTHPSQPNYIALFSGSTQGITNDSCPHDLPTTANLGSQLAGAGLSFVGYSEELPWPGYRGCSNGTSYARKHAPWVDFTAVPASANRSLSDLPTDFRRLPTVSFVVPNLCNDMHDCPVSTGDSWAAAHLDGYLRWAGTHNSALIITFDEDDNGPTNQIVTIVAGQHVAPGRYGEPVDHYRLLRTIEAGYGLPGLGTAASRTPITDIWR